LKKGKKKRRKEGSFDETISEQCTELPKKKKYKRKAMVTWLNPGGCKAITCFNYKPNLCVLSCSTPNQKEKKIERERPEHPRPNSLPKSHLIKPY